MERREYLTTLSAEYSSSYLSPCLHRCFRLHFEVGYLNFLVPFPPYWIYSCCNCKFSNPSIKSVSSHFWFETTNLLVGTSFRGTLIELILGTKLCTENAMLIIGTKLSMVKCTRYLSSRTTIKNDSTNTRNIGQLEFLDNRGLYNFHQFILCCHSVFATNRRFEVFGLTYMHLLILVPRYI